MRQRPLHFGGATVHAHAARKGAADALLDVAAEVGASLVLVGSRGMHGTQAIRPGERSGQGVSSGALQRLDRRQREPMTAEVTPSPARGRCCTAKYDPGEHPWAL